MEKYIRGIEELNLGNKISGGSCSDIYEFGCKTYFKLFNEDYRDLDDSINVEFYETISYLSELKGMEFIVRGKNVYRSADELFGYSMDAVEAGCLSDVSDDVKVEDVFTGFKLLRKDIRVLADNFVKTEDIGGDNILFNGFMYLLDLDLSLVDKRYIPDELYERCVNSVICGIRSKVLGDARYGEDILPDESDEYFDYLRDACSEGLGRKVTTIGEMRSGYQKVKRYLRCS